MFLTWLAFVAAMAVTSHSVGRPLPWQPYVFFTVACWGPAVLLVLVCGISKVVNRET